MVRTAALLAVLAVLAWYYGFSEDLPTLGLWGDVVFLSFGLIPLTFLLPLIALPLRRSRMERLGWAAVGLVGVSVLLEVADLKRRAEALRVQSISTSGGKLIVRLRRDARVSVDKLIAMVSTRPGASFSPTGVLTVEAPGGGEEVLRAASSLLAELADTAADPRDPQPF